MAATNTKIPLFERERITELFLGLSLDNREKIEEDKKLLEDLDLKVHTTEEATRCSCCNYTFTDRHNQVMHYKSDWHRYNLKISLISGEAVSESQFEEIIDDISSISGSDSERTDSDGSSEDDTRDSRLSKAISNLSPLIKSEVTANTPFTNSHVKRSPKMFFRNSNNSLLSVYKCILPYSVEEKDAHQDMNELVRNKSKDNKVCIILLSAGHFAAGVFVRGEPMVHKTYHRYVMRAKQGTVQSVRDGQNSASAPKSAGASLRRHNEAALSRDIQGLLTSWKDDYISQCSHIFLRAPHHQKGVFYDGKTAPFIKRDARIRGIPFPTRRPTFNELKRVWKELYSVEIHDAEPNEGVKKVCHNNTPDPVLPDKITEPKNNTPASEHKRVITASPRRKKKQRKQERVEEQNLTEAETNEMAHASTITDTAENSTSHVIDELYTVCKIGDLEGLKAIVASLAQEVTLVSEEDQIIPLYLNQTLGPNEETTLHIAAKAGHKEIAYHLMKIGADPAVKNKMSSVPYSVSSDKAMRNMFRKFMADYPDKYDYKSAQIPAPLTEEMEKRQRQKANEKKKAQRTAKKNKQKETQAEKARTDKENEEKVRFAALSDREKRAIAAERRMAQQMSLNGMQGTSNTKRCWMCGESLLGKIPFEYLDFQFCAMSCLKKHKSLESMNK